ncbi:hypothetical protein CIB95_01380 [Lottiidibacillus patelloidae]|uniref:Uncharacterized protein n=1 Tax=Lottiidibacillus patelloidae TaxID=2670334 RepID=A0A263BYD3_9BACI|nr:hypothetical protein CIB95_01380 [Lottiidibacillus patelloidae]
MRFFLLLLGFGLACIGGISIIAYLNLITTGLTFTEYLIFISYKIECYFFPVGVILIWFSIYGRKWEW